MAPPQHFHRSVAVGAIAMMIATASAADAQRTGAPPGGRDVSGNWVFWRNGLGSRVPRRLHVEKRGDSLFASTGNGLSLRGRAVDDRAILSGQERDSSSVRLEVRWQGDSLVGTTTMFGDAVPAWLVREGVRPPSAPTVHAFQPTAFHRVFSSLIAPALRIWPGDTIRTETISALGTDSKDVRRSLGGNPLTGPFYVEGALPGDVVVVHLLRVRTNRASASSGAGLASNAVTASYLFDYTDAEDQDNLWVIDSAAGVARLKSPSDALRGLVIPLRPMLGCIGVAPGTIDRPESRSSGLPGSYGGNMDYNRIVEGATLNFQVTHPGALLFVGDGHAAQGDGELTGSALETSLDVEFSVELIRDKSIGFPRIEDSNHVMSAGIGGSLHDAFQIATTGLARWLEQDYKLTRSEVATIMGAAAQFDIAEVVDRDYNVVAKLPKSVLRSIAERR